MKTLILAIIAFLMSQPVFACMGARIVLNDDVTLTGEGISSKVDGTYDLNELTKKQWTGIELPITDSKKTQTHSVVFLGGTQDREGIISVSFLVKDMKTGLEKVFLLKSNYDGNGTRSRDLERPESQGKQDPKFKMLETAGC